MTTNSINITLLDSDQKAEIWHLGCYANEGKDIFLQEGINYDLRHQEIMSDTMHKLNHLADYVTSELKIPAITHQFYATSKSSPKQIDQISHSKSINTTERLNQVYSSWRHFFWTNNIDIVPADIKNIKGLEVHSIDELKEHILYPELQEILQGAEVDKALFSKASDLIRYMALQIFGGVFHDLDYELYEESIVDFFELLTAFTFIGGLEKHEAATKVEISPNVSGSPNVGSSFVAAIPNHPVINKVVSLMVRNLNPDNSSDLPEYVQFPCNLLQKVMYEVGPTALTMAYYLGAGELDILMPRNILFNAEYAWSTTTGSRCSTNEVVSLYSDYNGVQIKTKGADMFCGSWALNNHNDYFKLTYYKENIDLYLYRAAQDGKLEEVISLINDGADIETRKINNITPIIIASQRGHKEVVQLLLDKGVDITVTFNGLTALEMARANNHPDIVDLFLAYKGAPKPITNIEDVNLIAGYNNSFAALEAIQTIKLQITKVTQCLMEQDPELELDLVSLCGIDIL